jgi:hypothetical protein
MKRNYAGVPDERGDRLRQIGSIGVRPALYGVFLSTKAVNLTNFTPHALLMTDSRAIHALLYYVTRYDISQCVTISLT